MGFNSGFKGLIPYGLVTKYDILQPYYSCTRKSKIVNRKDIFVPEVEELNSLVTLCPHSTGIPTVL